MLNKVTKLSYGLLILFATVSAVPLLLFSFAKLSKSSEGAVAVEQLNEGKDEPAKTTEVTKQVEAPSKKTTATETPKKTTPTTKPADQDLTIKIINGRGVSGIGTALTKLLNSEGFMNVEAENGPRAFETTVSFKRASNADKILIPILEENIVIAKKVTAKSTQVEDVVITLGQP